jgi:hypothetical protein
MKNTIGAQIDHAKNQPPSGYVDGAGHPIVFPHALHTNANSSSSAPGESHSQKSDSDSSSCRIGVAETCSAAPFGLSTDATLGDTRAATLSIALYSEAGISQWTHAP